MPSSVPPDEPTTQPAGGTRPPGYGPSTVPFAVARLPIPGNAELLVWILALLVAALVAAVADSVDAPAWFDFFKWTAAAYLLSRGIAKASRVLEH